MSVTDPSHFGTLILGEPETVELTHPRDPRRTFAVRCARGAWRPPERLARFLPEDFSVPLECYTAGDGRRRIRLRCNYEELIDLGAGGGLAVIHGMRGFDKEVDYAYRAMLLIHEHVRGRAYCGTRGMKEHLTREFHYSRDLHIRPPGRLSYDQRDVLPDNLGRTAQGTGQRPSVTQLTKRGREAAQEAGYRNPTSRRAIAFGLYEAIKRNPVLAEPENVAALVRMALFDVASMTPDPSPEVIQYVTERLLKAIESHLAEPQADFDRWFSGPSNTLVKQIARQKGEPGGRLNRDEVRKALLRLGWDAYTYVGQCVHALMRTVKNSISPPLDAEEARLFECMYESQPYYGGFPAALLAERMSFLRQAVLAIWNEPQNPEHVGVLHGLLACYAEMAPNRREADRQSKQRSPASFPESSQGDADDKSGQTAAVDVGAGGSDSQRRPKVCFVGQNDGLLKSRPTPASEGSALTEVAEHLRQLYEIKCPVGCVFWCYQGERTPEGAVRIDMECECGRIKKSITMTEQGFTAEAHKVLEFPQTGPPDAPTPVDTTQREC